MHSDSKKRRSFLALLFAAGDVKRYAPQNFGESTMLAVLLEFNVKPGSEPDFVRYWEETTQIIYKKFGSLGSRLHKSESGMYIAYAQWPSIEVYESEQSWSEEERIVRENMRATLVNGKPSIVHKLSVVSDLTKENTISTGSNA